MPWSSQPACRRIAPWASLARILPASSAQAGSPAFGTIIPMPRTTPSCSAARWLSWAMAMWRSIWSASLAKTVGEFAGSDLSHHHVLALGQADVETIDIVGRSPAETGQVRSSHAPRTRKAVRRRNRGGRGSWGGQGGRSPRGDKRPCAGRRAQAHHLPLRMDAHAAVRHRAARSGAFHGQRRLGETLVLACDSFLTAIGFGGAGEGPAAGEDGFVEPGLYAAGWLRRGPRGTIRKTAPTPKPSPRGSLPI
jgi:hypothetical protein